MDFVYKQYIGGQWIEASNGGQWDVTDPATGEHIATVPFGDAADVRRAIEAADKARCDWARRTSYERGAILTRAARLIEDTIDVLAMIMTRETGKPLTQSKGEWGTCAQLLDWFAEEGKRAYGRIIPSRHPEKRMFVIVQPIGVVGTITAWNFPAYLPARTWAAALAAGCTVIGRPSELTPLTAMSLVNLLVEAGLPAGVMNLVNGEPDTMGEEMLRNPLCRKLSFTGSTRVGRILMRGAADSITKLSLELGGNAPVIVFADADVGKAAHEGVAYKFRNCGQVCNSPTRYFVHRDIEQAFLEAVTEQTRKLVVGIGTHPEVHVGPLINSRQLHHVEDLVQDALDNGAKLLTGGHRVTDSALSRGNFFEPTVLANVTNSMRIAQEEVFGPLLPVVGFSDIDEVVELANATEYGLAGYLWTHDLNVAVAVSERLECGMIGINTIGASAVEAPFGGFKQSGIGRECGAEGLLNYMETKLVTLTL